MGAKLCKTHLEFTATAAALKSHSKLLWVSGWGETSLKQAAVRTAPHKIKLFAIKPHKEMTALQSLRVQCLNYCFKLFRNILLCTCAVYMDPKIIYNPAFR